MLRKENLCLKVVLIIVLVSFVACILWSDKNYNDLLTVNDDLLEQIDTNRTENDRILAGWKMSYDSLQTKYGHLLVEYDELEKSIDTVELPTYNYTQAEVELLAVCVQCEAGEQNYEAQRDIASVILNRVKSSLFPNTIEEVIYENNNGVPQFSVAYNGMMDECVLSPTVLNNVYGVLMYGNDLPEEVLYFYSASLSENNWIRSLPVYDTIEGTVFAYEKR